MMSREELAALRERLRAMPAVDVAEEFERVWEAMDAESCDNGALRVYMDVLEEKAPAPPMPDRREGWRRLLERIEALRETGNFDLPFEQTEANERK